MDRHHTLGEFLLARRAEDLGLKSMPTRRRDAGCRFGSAHPEYR